MSSPESLTDSDGDEGVARARVAIHSWIDHHPGRSFLDLGSLSRDLSARVTPFFLVRALSSMAAHDEVRVKYRVRLPSGEFSETEFDSLDQAPRTVFDADFNPHQVTSREVIPVYHLRVHASP